MNAREIASLGSDLPVELSELVEQMAQAKKWVESTNFHTLTKGEWTDNIRPLLSSFNVFCSLYLEIIRRHALDQELRDFTLPKLLLAPGFKPTDTDKDEAPIRREEPWWDAYTNKLVEDLQKTKNNLYASLKPPLKPDSVFFYLAEMDSELDRVASAIKRAKSRWLEEIGLEPFTLRQRKVEFVYAVLNWRLEALNRASYKLLNSYLSKGFKKKPGFVAFVFLKIYSTYYRRVYGLVDSLKVAELHSTRQFAPLNTVLRIVSEPEGVLASSIKLTQTVSSKQGLLPSFLNQLADEYNFTVPRMVERSIVFELFYAQKAPKYDGRPVEAVFSKPQLRQLFAGPSSEDYSKLWTYFMLYMLSEAGYAVLKTPVERKFGS